MSEKHPKAIFFKELDSKITDYETEKKVNLERVLEINERLKVVERTRLSYPFTEERITLEYIKPLEEERTKLYDKNKEIDKEINFLSHITNCIENEHKKDVD